MRDFREKNKLLKRNLLNNIETMLQKPEDIRQDRFLKAVEKLHLRFPNREITEKTGYKSGIVSEYLNSKKNVSERFLREFCEAFGLDYNKVVSLPAPVDSEDPDIYWKAKAQALEIELAQLKSFVYGMAKSPRTYEDCFADIENRTRLLANDLKAKDLKEEEQ